MNNELNTTYNKLPIMDEYQEVSNKKIDEVLGSFPQPNIEKFNFAPNPKAKKNQFIKKTFLTLASCLLILSLGLAFFMMPLISGATEILPINPNPSNEKLTVTSKRSSFFVNYNNKTYYSTNQNGVHTLDLGKITGNDKIKVGTFIDFGFFKLNSSKTEEFPFNRNYEINTVTTTLKKYFNIAKGDYKITINSPEKYFRVTNGEATIYETGANKNLCKSEEKEKITTLSCQYDFGEEKKNINYNLKVQDEFGNIKELEAVVAELVPVNDFNCNTKSIYSLSKVTCVGNKNGKVIINSGESIDYVANKKIDLPIAIKEGDNKVSIKMIDEHGFENSLNLDFIFDNTPLKVAITSDEDSITATSNKDNTNIEVNLTLNYANIITGKKSSKDFSSKVKLTNSSIPNSIPTKIMDNSIILTSEEFGKIKLLDVYKSGTATIKFEDQRGKTDTKTCEVDAKESNKKFILKLDC